MSDERLSSFNARRRVQPLGLTNGAWSPNALMASLVQIDVESGLPEVAVPEPIGFAGVLFIQSAPVLLWADFQLTEAAQAAGTGFAELLASINAYNTAIGVYNVDVVAWIAAANVVLAPLVLPAFPVAPTLLNLPIADDLVLPFAHVSCPGISSGNFPPATQAQWDFASVPWMETAKLAPSHASWAGLGRIPCYPFAVSTNIENPDPAYVGAALFCVGVGGTVAGYPPFADFIGSGDGVPCLMRQADYTRAMFDAGNRVVGANGIVFLVVGLWNDLQVEP